LPNKYTTVAGDTWDGIAYRTLGSENYAVIILDANPEHNYVAKFSDGVELTIPDLPSPALPTSLPPWRIA
jgi:phage tail protein X